MTWEEKLCALNNMGAGKAELGMNKPGDWYCVVPTAKLAGSGFTQSFNGFGNTPNAAIDDLWMKVMFLPKGITHIQVGTDRRIKWNGFMWEDIRES